MILWASFVCCHLSVVYCNFFDTSYNSNVTVSRQNGAPSRAVGHHKAHGCYHSSCQETIQAPENATGSATGALLSARSRRTTVSSCPYPPTVSTSRFPPTSAAQNQEIPPVIDVSSRAPSQ